MSIGESFPVTSCVRTRAGYCVRTRDMGPEVSICGHDVILTGSDVIVRTRAYGESIPQQGKRGCLRNC